MRSAFKNFLQSRFPSLWEAAKSYGFFLRCRREFGDFQIRFRKEVYGDGTPAVLSGPFVGMKYFDRIVWGPITPKWIGCYEAELAAVVEQMVAAAYEVIVDVGAAEGYYAVGMAFRCPKTRVVSFDIDPIARRRQVQLRDLNGLGNLAVRKRCTHSELAALGQGHCAVICDIEGAEAQLLDPSLCPELAACDLLVELHGSGGLSIFDVQTLLTERFSPTHEISVFYQQGRDAAGLKARIPALSQVDQDTVGRAANECRGILPIWLWMVAKPK